MFILKINLVIVRLRQATAVGLSGKILFSGGHADMRFSAWEIDLATNFA